MRLRACLAGLLLGTSACAQLPGLVRIDVDGRSIELRQGGFSAETLKGGWSASPDCREDDSGAARLNRRVSDLRVIGPDEIEVHFEDGETLRLFRCDA